MTRDALLVLARSVMKTAQGIRLEIDPDSEIVPVCHLAHRNGMIDVIALDWSSPEAKDKNLAQLAVLVNSPECEGYLIVTEAWALKLPKETNGGVLPRPSESPDRIEIIAVVGQTAEGKGVSLQATIQRDRYSVIGFGKTEEFTGGSNDYSPGVSRGKLLDILTPRTATPVPSSPRAQ